MYGNGYRVVRSAKIKPPARMLLPNRAKGTSNPANYKVLRSADYEVMSFCVYEVPRFHTQWQKQEYLESLSCRREVNVGLLLMRRVQSSHVCSRKITKVGAPGNEERE